jgi:hypothetical protein
MSDLTLMARFRSWLAGRLFTLAGKLDDSYDVWLDDAPRRGHDAGWGADSLKPREQSVERT